MDMLAWYMANRLWAHGSGHTRTWRQVRLLIAVGADHVPSRWGGALDHALLYAKARLDKDSDTRDDRMDAHRDAFNEELWRIIRKEGLSPSTSDKPLVEGPSFLDKLTEQWEAHNPDWKKREALHLRRVLNPTVQTRAHEERQADKALATGKPVKRDMPALYYVPVEEFFARVEQKFRRDHPGWNRREQQHRKRVADPRSMSSKSKP